MNLAFSDEIKKGLEPVNTREKNLREAIKLSGKTIDDLNQNAKSAVKEINETFGKMQESLEKRRSELVNEVEKVRQVKEKKLKIQREDFEFFAEEMRCCGEFGSGLIEQGDQVEVAMSKNSLLERLRTLKEKRIEMNLPEDSTMRFNEGGKGDVIRVISGFGTISGNQTSSGTSKIEWMSGSAPVSSSSSASGTRSKAASMNERISFKIISMNKEGERIKRGGDHYLVEVGDKSQTPAEVVDQQDGSYSVSFVANVKGRHQVSVSFDGSHIQGSPFDLRVACVSAKTSYLEASKDLGLFPGLGPIELKIVAVEEDGSPLKQGGENFSCTVTINNQPQAPPLITDLNYGAYSVKFTPNSSGKCSISVKLDGQEIKGSPLSLDVSTYDFFGGPKQFQLLYDAKVDGYSARTFHAKCDNIPGTVTLVTLQNGAKFGGYNPGTWTSEGGVYKNVPNCFLFSVTDGKGSGPQKFALKNGQEGSAIYCGSGYGPTFGGAHDLHLNLDSLPSSGSSPHTYSLPSNTALAGSYNNWSFANVQVFKVN